MHHRAARTLVLVAFSCAGACGVDILVRMSKSGYRGVDMNDMSALSKAWTCRKRVGRATGLHAARPGRAIGRIVIAGLLCVVLSGCGHSITVSGVDSERVGWALSEVLRDEGISHTAGRGHCESRGSESFLGLWRVETNIHESGGQTRVTLAYYEGSIFDLFGPPRDEAMERFLLACMIDRLAGYPEFEVVRSSDSRLMNHIPIPANNAGRVLLSGVSREDVQRSLEFWTPLSPGYGNEPMVFNVAGSAVREERRGWLDPRYVHWQVTLRSEGDATLLTVNGCETKLPSVSAIEDVPVDERFTDTQREEWMARVIQRLRKTHADLEVSAYEPAEE